MPRFSITRVYLVEAPNEAVARRIMDACVLSTFERFPVRLDWESVRPDPADVKGWAEIIRDQLLGPSKKSQS